MDGWREDGLEQYGDDCGVGEKDEKKWRAPVHTEMIEFNAAIFAWPCVLSDRPPALWWLSPGEEWDAVTCRSWGKL